MKFKNGTLGDVGVLLHVLQGHQWTMEKKSNRDLNLKSEHHKIRIQMQTLNKSN